MSNSYLLIVLCATAAAAHEDVQALVQSSLSASDPPADESTNVPQKTVQMIIDDPVDAVRQEKTATIMLQAGEAEEKTATRDQRPGLSNDAQLVESAAMMLELDSDGTNPTKKKKKKKTQLGDELEELKGSLPNDIRSAADDANLLPGDGKTTLRLPAGTYSGEALPAIETVAYTYGHADAVSSAIMDSGAWEPELVQKVRAQLQKAGKSAILFDLGTNIGDFTLNAAKDGYDVFSFEMVKSSWYKVVASAQEANISHHIHFVRSLALSDAVGNPVIFEKFQNNEGGTAAVEETVSSRPTCVDGDARGVTCSTTTTMDHLLEEGIFQSAVERPIVMKIDIESHECMMLNGAPKFFEQFGPQIQYLQVEITADGKVACKKQFDDKMHELGLKFIETVADDNFYQRM